MAIFKISPVTGPISGNVGPVNFVAGAQGNIIRIARRATSGRSTAQLEAHTSLKKLSSDWTAFTASEQRAWTVAARDVPSLNRLGDRRILNGRQFFIAYNMPTQALSPPVTKLKPPLITQSPSAVNFQVDTFIPDNFRITWDPPFPPPSDFLFIYGFRPYLAHATRHTPYWTRIAIIENPFVNQDILPATELALGALVNGEDIHYQVWWRQTGRLNSGVQLPTTIANVT